MFSARTSTSSGSYLRRSSKALFSVRLSILTKTLTRSATPAHYVLKYNIMPWVGALTYGEAARTEEPVPFPAAKALN
jgi:hypothetical protein